MRAYPALQVGGWALYAALGVGMERVFGALTPASALTDVASCAAACGLTHLLRGHIRRRRWFDHGVPALAARLAAASVLVTLVVVTFALLFGLFVSHAYTWRPSTPAILFASSLNWLFATLLWVTLYAAVHYLRHFRQAEIRRLQLEVAARDAQLEALSARVHPHFFFNAMNSLRALIAEDPERARQMATEIAELMRYALQAARRERVQLREELEVTRSYLQIEGVRFEERLSWTLGAAGVDPRALLPPLLLQTLVENAVKHGVARSVEGGAVRVHVTAADGRLELRVESPGTLSAEPGHGVGLELARERLRLLHGVRGTLALAQATPALVVATATLPLEVDA